MPWYIYIIIKKKKIKKKKKKKTKMGNQVNNVILFFKNFLEETKREPTKNVDSLRIKRKNTK